MAATPEAATADQILTQRACDRQDVATSLLQLEKVAMNKMFMMAATMVITMKTHILIIIAIIIISAIMHGMLNHRITHYHFLNLTSISSPSP
jgi:hypothetical protein